MDTFLNEQEQWLLELVETKSYTELSDAERAFVLKHLAQAEFDLQHLLIKETKHIVDDLDTKPLQPVEKKSRMILIPLYQAILGVAATLVLSFLFIQSKQSSISKNEKMELAVTDTVYVEKQILDTVFKYEYIDRIVKIESEKSVTRNAPSSANRQEITIAEPILRPLNELDLQNKGVSLANDETFSLVHDINDNY